MFFEASVDGNVFGRKKNDKPTTFRNVSVIAGLKEIWAGSIEGAFYKNLVTTTDKCLPGNGNYEEPM